MNLHQHKNVSKCPAVQNAVFVNYLSIKLEIKIFFFCIYRKA